MYRCLNRVHSFCYKSLTSAMRDLHADIELVHLGLITSDEEKDLLPMGNKMHDTVLAWLGAEINTLAMEGNL